MTRPTPSGSSCTRSPARRTGPWSPPKAWRTTVGSWPACPRSRLMSACCPAACSASRRWRGAPTAGGPGARPSSPGALAARPDALAGPGGAAGEALAVVGRSVLRARADLSSWSRATSVAALGSASPGCGATALDAVAMAPDGTPLVATDCRRGGRIGIFSRVAGKWSAHRSRVGRPVASRLDPGPAPGADGRTGDGARPGHSRRPPLARRAVVRSARPLDRLGGAGPPEFVDRGLDRVGRHRHGGRARRWTGRGRALHGEAGRWGGRACRRRRTAPSRSPWTRRPRPGATPASTRSPSRRRGSACTR